MIKLTGALLVIGTCLAFALKLIGRQRETISALRELDTLLKALAQNISLHLEPLPLLIRRLAAEKAAPAPEFLTRLTPLLDEDSCQPISPLWQEAFSAFADEKRLPDKARSLMNALGEHLGQADAATEAERLHSTAAEIQALYKELEQNRIKAEKTTGSLGVLLGLFIVILLL